MLTCHGLQGLLCLQHFFCFSSSHLREAKFNTWQRKQWAKTWALHGPSHPSPPPSLGRVWSILILSYSPCTGTKQPSQSIFCKQRLGGPALLQTFALKWHFSPQFSDISQTCKRSWAWSGEQTLADERPWDNLPTAQLCDRRSFWLGMVERFETMS